MKFKSRFDIGQRVYSIGLYQNSGWKKCSFCVGIGSITGANGEERNCPDCRGYKGATVYGGEEYRVSLLKLTVGQVRIECTYSKRSKSLLEQKESYMMVETGIGSGAIWHLEELFESITLAQDECDRRNGLKKENQQ